MDKVEATTETGNVLNQALIDIITGVTTNVGTAKDFILAQLPDVIQQLIMFNLVYRSFLVSLGIILLLMSVVGLITILRWKNFDSNDDVAQKVMLLIVTIISGFIGLLSFLFNVKELLMLYFAPKVWLIEYAVHLVK